MSGRREGGVVAPSPSFPRLARKCSVGCPILDSLLDGGIPCGSITELVGECGSGKTQICLQLLLSAQMPLSQGGLHASSLYIYTESYFPSKRLQQLAKGFLDAGKLRLRLSPSQKKRLSLQNNALSHPLERDCTTLNSHNSTSPHLYNHTNAISAIPSGPESIADGTVLQYRGRKPLPGDHELHHNLSIHGRAAKRCHLQNDNSDICIETYGDGILPNQQGNYVASYVDGGELQENNHPCDNIFVQSIQNVEELNVFLDQVHLLLSRPLAMPVRLLVIDSVAALFRSDFNNNAKDLAMRTEWFFKLSSKLKKYAHDYDIAILVTNQVMDDVDCESLGRQNSVDAMLSGNSGPLISAGRNVIPALGIGWSHCINTRLFLSRTYVPEKQAYFQYQQTGLTEISSKISSDAHYRKVNCSDMGSEPHVSVLQQLESEVPDEFLLILSQKKSASSCSGTNDKPNLACSRVEGEADAVAGHASLQDVRLDGNSRITDVKSLPLCSVRRRLQIVFAPHLPASSCEFLVTTTQICGVSSTIPVRAVYGGECKY